MSTAEAKDKSLLSKIKGKFKLASEANMARSGNTADSSSKSSSLGRVRSWRSRSTHTLKERAMGDFVQHANGSLVSLVKHFECSLTRGGEEAFPAMIMIVEEEIRVVSLEDDSRSFELPYPDLLGCRVSGAELLLDTRLGPIGLSDLSFQFENAYYSIKVGWNQFKAVSDPDHWREAKWRTACGCGHKHNGISLVRMVIEGFSPSTLAQLLLLSSDDVFSAYASSTAELKASTDRAITVHELFGDLEEFRRLTASTQMVVETPDLVQVEVEFPVTIKTYDHRLSLRIMACFFRPDPQSPNVGLHFLLSTSSCPYKEVAAVIKDQLAPVLAEWLTQAAEGLPSASDDPSDYGFGGIEARPCVRSMVYTWAVFELVPRLAGCRERVVASKLFRSKEHLLALLLMVLAWRWGWHRMQQAYGQPSTPIMLRFEEHRAASRLGRRQSLYRLHERSKRIQQTLNHTS